MSEPVIVKERMGGKYTQDVMTSRHHLYADEPASYGSADLGPTPFEFLCAGLGACTSITLRMYIERKGWDIENIKVEVSHKKVSRGDTPANDVFTRVISFEGDVDEEQRTRLLQIADKCPVHKTLEAKSVIITESI